MAIGSPRCESAPPCRATAGDFHGAILPAKMLPVYTGAHETLFLERQRDRAVIRKGTFQKLMPNTGPTSCVCRKPRPRRPGRDRHARFPRVLKLGRQERLFGNGYFLGAGAYQGHQRFPRRLRKKVHVCRRAQARLVEQRPRHYRRVRSVPRGHSVHAQRRGRSFAPEAAARTLGPGLSRVRKTTRQEEAGDFCGDLNVAHTSSILRTRNRIAGKKGFTDKERAGFQNFVDAGFVDTFRLFTKATATTPGGATSPIRGRATWDGESTTCSFQAMKKKVKDNGDPCDVIGSDHCPVSIKLEIWILCLA